MKLGWEYKKLCDVAYVFAGQGAPQGNENYSATGTPFIKAGNLEDLVNGLPEDEVQKVSEEVAKSHRLKIYKAGSVLFAKSGMSCMKGWVYTLKKDCYVVSHLAIITPKTINSSFLNYYLRHYKPNSLVQDSAYPSIPLKDIENLHIQCPNLNIQVQIVSELDLLSGAIEKQKAQIEELDKLVQSIFYDMFGDPITGKIKWEVKRLSEISNIGTGSTPSRNNPLYYNGGNIPWIKTTEVQNCEIYESEEKITNLAIQETNCKIYPIGTILMAMYGQGKTRGQLAKLKIVAATNQACAAISLNSELVNNEFVYQYLHLQYDEIRGMARGGNQPNLNLDIVKAIPIILPPISMQHSFAEKVESIEKMKAKVRQSLRETEQLFNSRMDYYFN